MAIRAFSEFILEQQTYFSKENAFQLVKEIGFFETIVPAEQLAEELLIIQSLVQDVINQHIVEQQKVDQRINEINEYVESIPEGMPAQVQKLKMELRDCLLQQKECRKTLDEKEKIIAEKSSPKAITAMLAEIFKYFHKEYAAQEVKPKSFIQTLLVLCPDTEPDDWLLAQHEAHYRQNIFDNSVLPIFRKMKAHFEVFALVDRVAEQALVNAFVEYLFLYVSQGTQTQKLGKQYQHKGVVQQHIVHSIPSSAPAKVKQDIEEMITPYIALLGEQQTRRLRVQIAVVRQVQERLYETEKVILQKLAEREKREQLLHERTSLQEGRGVAALQERINKETQYFISRLYTQAERQLERSEKKEAAFVSAEGIQNPLPAPALSEPDVQAVVSWVGMRPELIYTHDATKAERRYYVSFSESVLKGMQGIPKMEQQKYLRALQRGFGSKYKESCIKMLDKDGDATYQCAIKVLGDKWRVKAVEREHNEKKWFYFCWFGSDKQGV